MNERANERPNKQARKRKALPSGFSGPSVPADPSVTGGQPGVPGPGNDRTFSRLAGTVGFWVAAPAPTEGHPGCLLGGSARVPSLAQRHCHLLCLGLGSIAWTVNLVPRWVSHPCSPQGPHHRRPRYLSARETGVRWASRGRRAPPPGKVWRQPGSGSTAGGQRQQRGWGGNQERLEPAYLLETDWDMPLGLQPNVGSSADRGLGVSGLGFTCCPTIHSYLLGVGFGASLLTSYASVSSPVKGS